MAEEAKERRAEQLWQKFLVITQEMLKFLTKEDIDEFLELTAQRGELQKQLAALGRVDYTHTEAGQALYRQLKPLDLQVQFMARSWLNKNRQRTVQVDNYGQPARFIGHVFNRGM